MTKAKPPKGAPFFETAEVPESALRIYARLWQFEIWLRQMVYVELRALRGDAWSDGLPVDSGPRRADKQLTHMPTAEMNALSFSQLSQLTKLVADNWDCFATYLPPQSLWDAKLKEISQIRHRVAHFRTGHVDDHARVVQFLRDIDKGFWQFCTSYNDPSPVLPQEDDRLTDHYIAFDPLPWSEISQGQWARIGHVNKSEPVGMTIEALTRPWTVPSRTVDGCPGILYDVHLMAFEGRQFDYRALLERTRRLHEHFVHIILDNHEESLRVTVPAVLGSDKLINLVGQLREAAHSTLTRRAGHRGERANAIADEWPEHVLGPQSPLSFLAPGMPCSFFNV
jgi:hypothetical protein